MIPSTQPSIIPLSLVTRLVLASLCLSLLGVASGCGPSVPSDRASSEGVQSHAVPPPAEIDPLILQRRSFKEAPILAERVANGELPSVSDRLPANPLIVKPLEEIGRYGGTIRRAVLSEYTGVTAIAKTLNENLLGFSRPVADSIELNLAEEYSFSDDGREAVFRLRKGLRWSDGEPFTTDDILFWYYDIVHDPNAYQLGVASTDWRINGKPIRMEKIDDLSIRLTADEPTGMLLTRLCHDNFAIPKHIFARFHPRYDPEADYDDFKRRVSRLHRRMEPGIPMLSAWVPERWIRGRKIVFKRNPYYWKVDTAGNQLPYADRLTFTVTGDSRVTLLRFVNGEFDLIGRNLQVESIPTLQAEAAKGRFTLRSRWPDSGPALYLNWDAKKASLRTAFRDIRVRRALSHAINRVEIRELVYHGILHPSGHCFAPSSPYHSVENEGRYSEFDPALASSLLSDSGYRDTDGDGFLEFPDGKRFEVTIDVTHGMGLGDLAELIADYWGAVGISVHLNPGREEIIYARRLNGEFDIYLYKLAAAVEPRNSPFHWAIIDPNTPFWHRNASSDAPAWLWEATGLMKRALTTVQPEKVETLLRRIENLHSENVPIIGIGALALPWAASARLGNLPQNGTFASAHRGWSRTVFHEQIFFRDL